jgi:hypothetical protein
MTTRRNGMTDIDTLDMDHAADVYGDPQKKRNPVKWDHKAIYLGTGTAAGMKKEIIELRLQIVDQFGKKMYWREMFFESYCALRHTLVKYGLTALEYPQFMLWLNETQDKEVKFDGDHTIFTYTLPQYHYEKGVIMDLKNETPDDIILPRGV